MNLNTSGNRTSANHESPPKKTFGSFKSMKRDKIKKAPTTIEQDVEMENAGGDESELATIKRDIAKLHEAEKKD